MGPSVSDVLDVLFLAGRNANAAPGRALTPLLDALAGRGIRVRVVCLARSPTGRADPRFLEYPGLGNRWPRAIRLRRLGRAEDLGNAGVLHVLHEHLNPVGLALVEAWKL